MLVAHRGKPNGSGTASGGMGRPFWVFFVASWFFDLGFGLYFFLVNLYLAQIHLNEKTIGLVAGALTVGNLTATIPIGSLARRWGLRPVLVLGFIAAPLFGAVRVFALWTPMQVALSFLQGAAMCSYTVCFPPTIAHLTTEDRRTTGFSIAFATGIGSGAAAGLAGGWIPGWLYRLGPAHDLASGMRMVLLLASAIVAFGLFPLARLRFPMAPDEDAATAASPTSLAGMTPFLLPFLTAVAIWNLAIGAFAPFANIYLANVLRVSLPGIGAIFSASQLLQVAGVSAAPLLYRCVGKTWGIGCLQLVAAAAMFLLTRVHQAPFAVAVYLLLMCVQYTCSPGIYSLAMDRTPAHLQSSVSASQNMVTCIVLAGAAAIAGAVISRFGYGILFGGTAVCAIVAAAAFVAIDSRLLKAGRLPPELLRRPATQSEGV